MTTPRDPASPEFEDRIQRAERGDAGATDAFQRLIGAIRTDLADRPRPEVLSRIVAMGAPRAMSAEGRPWWQALESVVATLVGRTAPGDLAGVRSGAATAEHLAFETDDLAIDVALTALDGDRWRLEGMVEAISDTDSPDTAARVAACSIGNDPQAIETTIAADGRFVLTTNRRPDRLIVECRGRAAAAHLDTLMDTPMNTPTTGRD
jgi:hypothetical protein